jgi:hypothetical protein
MCSEQEKKTSGGISRRSFAAMAVASAGLSLLPIRTHAAGTAIDGVGIMCIDYRLVDEAVKFFDQKMPGHYDLVALAGASLASVSQMFPASVDALWNHITIAHTLHSIKHVVVLDHRDCGAYKQEFGPAYVGDNGAGELAQHQQVMARMRTQFVARGFDRLGLQMQFFLMSQLPPYAVVPVTA